MESNIDVSPHEASHALAVVEADQKAIRTAAQPPKWYFPGLSLCLGAIVVCSGILPMGSWIAIILMILIAAVEGFMLGVFRSVQTVKGRWSRSTIVRSVPFFLVWLATIAVIIVLQFLSIPWWAGVCMGAAVAVLTYLSAKYASCCS